MFKKILIVNRGAIATRIIRTLKKMNVTSVVVFSEADRDSQHVLYADEAHCLGEGNAAETYLDIDKLFLVIRQSKVEAVHPGYGFLSENAEFALRCEQEGIVFLGPTAEQMRLFALKHKARELAEQNKLPLLPGSGLLQDINGAITLAQQIGYPLMLKSTAGGGGIGMQICADEKALVNAFESVKRLAASNFANNGVFIEKYIEQARHIEVQVFGDGKGQVITLLERDCSTQRRHQKVIEETPAVDLPDKVGKQLQILSRKLCETVNYASAGTVEYIYDQKTEEYYFLEVNTRLQVEHGVTEELYGIDLVEWMILLGANKLPAMWTLAASLKPQGHSIQVRLYAEDPNKNFQPSAGLLTEVSFPKVDKSNDAIDKPDRLRIDRWIETGIEVSSYYDPMLAKVIVHSGDRVSAIQCLQTALASIRLYGIETNVEYLRQIMASPIFKRGEVTTQFLSTFEYRVFTIDVLSAGTQTTIQDYPGRVGYWHVGVPPSGPFDNLSFRLGNRLLGNSEQCAGLELTLNGPTLKFNCGTRIVLTGACMQATLDGKPVGFWQVLAIKKNQTLVISKVVAAGARAYLLVQGGIDCPDYLGSRSTFTLGQFGGHNGRVLRVGDVLKLANPSLAVDTVSDGAVDRIATTLDQHLIPAIAHQWQLRVITGPHAAPDYFTEKDMQIFFESQWEVHYNSSRTGVRLIGPKPDWARKTGGEAGMHPSNIHDNAYAFGAVDFTGDMPVILGPDGPSLGGFVCPATLIQADLWKLGQLKAGDKLAFIPVTIEQATRVEKSQLAAITLLDIKSASIASTIEYLLPQPPGYSPVINTIHSGRQPVKITYRLAGDHFLLVEYGPQILDIELRFRVHALMEALQRNPKTGILELTPGIRSLQIHYNSQRINVNELLAYLGDLEAEIAQSEKSLFPSRIVHLPLSWNDDACQLAIEKYMQSVRQDAPWCPSNLEFIRRINGLGSIDAIKRIVFAANYVVLGLGDVYLGAPVATPLDPRHRLVTTKYNPARTWTAENSVGIGGAYLCIYGMEGPGGYQFIGRTLQMWNRYHKNKVFQQPWLLRFFDQICFYEVSHDELKKIRRDFPKGGYAIKIEQSEFDLKYYQQFLQDNKTSIDAFVNKRENAFNKELQHWIESGAINFSAESHVGVDEADEVSLAENEIAVESQLAGNVWKCLVQLGDVVESGQRLFILESMKMEIEVVAPKAGEVVSININEGTQVIAGQRLLVLRIKKDGRP